LPLALTRWSFACATCRTRVLAKSSARRQTGRLKSGETGDGSRGRGIGFARYKMQARIARSLPHRSPRKDPRPQDMRGSRCGLAVNPDGVKNQVEGGMVQAIS
jgi:hypothetical protein